MILLLEDDSNLAHSIQELLTLEGEKVVHASTLSECRTLLEDRMKDFEIILVDLMLPDGDGRDLIAWIRARSQATVIVMSAISENHTMVSSLRQGADDYLTKPFEPDFFLAKLDSIRRRSEGKETSLSYNYEGRQLEVDLNARAVLLNGSSSDLTSHEFDILVQLLRHKGHSVSKSDLYQAVGREQTNGDRVIDMHISRIRTKLKLREHIKTIWGRGYMLIRDEKV